MTRYRSDCTCYPGTACICLAPKATSPLSFRALPPGPIGVPFLGNIFDVPSGEYWLKYADMGEKWGNMFSLTILGRTTIIVNSLQIAEDLLETHGSNFSDRPVVPMGGELVGLKNAQALTQYGHRFKEERKLFRQLFGTQEAIQQFAPLQQQEIHRLLQNILQESDSPFHAIDRAVGAIIFRIAYGYHLCEGPRKDPFLDMAETASKNFSNSTKPAAFLVDVIPALRYWPEWLPGGGFKTTARQWARQLQDTVDGPFEFVKAQLANGTAEASFASTMLQKQPNDEHLIKWASTAIQSGGTDTNAAQIEAFLLAMMLYPSVQETAQREIDSVVGNDRLPVMADRANLPYMNALCKEVFRWHVAAPIAVPHRTRNNFIYQQTESKPLLIPKDSLVIPNIWKMTHDPERYADPMVFDPSRFLDSGLKKPELDPYRISFGFGRRLLGESTVFLASTTILAVFNISKKVENGIVCEPKLGQTTGTVSHPLPFKFIIQPRNIKAKTLIAQGECVNSTLDTRFDWNIDRLD
ncbi:cytochrome P450 [Mycena sp. CBHHK59/15]|nr:cytochrome P450 [Mycena sp. CBHHK59/15]